MAGQNVSELFLAEKIDKNFLSEMQDVSKYWEGAVDFVFSVWDRDVETLSPRQGKWLSSILDDCVEKRIEGKIS